MSPQKVTPVTDRPFFARRSFGSFLNRIGALQEREGSPRRCSRIPVRIRYEGYNGYFGRSHVASGQREFACRRRQVNGIDAAAQILKRRPETSVILLSMHADEDYVIRGLNAGVKGYILKESVERDLPLALEAVSKQRHFFSSAIGEVLLADYMRQLKHKHVPDSYDLLTEREKEVLQLLAEGKTNKDVAVLLNLSPQTIESHRANLMQKLGLHSTADIILYAVRKRIIS